MPALGAQLGLTADELASGIRAIAIEEMGKAARLLVTSSGLDPRQLAFVAYGGSGPLFAAEIARITRVPTVLAPLAASVLSAFGAASAEVRRERFVSVGTLFDELDAGAISSVMKELAAAVDEDVARDGVGEADRLVRFEADVRFYRQAFELIVEFDGATFDRNLVEESFLAQYRARYGEGAIRLGTPVELAAIRAVGVGRLPRAAIPTDSDTVPSGTPAELASLRPMVVQAGDARRRGRVRGWRPATWALHRGPCHHRAGRYHDRRPTEVVGRGRCPPHDPNGAPLMSLLADRSVDLSPLDVEILRHRIEALTQEASRTIQRTAISPVVVENGDYCTAILDADGGLVVGGGKIVMQFNGATYAVRTVMAVHEDISPGDIFLSNDPHHGGSLHPQDVFVIRPVHVDGVLVGWVANSAHMMDLGGMVPGSFSPDATECYQESVRVPPVRLARAGVEQRDVWAILLNNIRLSHLVEMDLRALMAGANVGHDRLVALIEETGIERYRAAVTDLNQRTRAAIEQRISELPEGVYRTTQWAEWKDERYRIPCTLTIEGSTLHFDFTGAAPADGPLPELQGARRQEHAQHVHGQLPTGRPADEPGLPGRVHGHLPGGLDLELHPSGTDRGRPHHRLPRRGRGGPPGAARGGQRLADLVREPVPQRRHAQLGPEPGVLGRGRPRRRLRRLADAGQRDDGLARRVRS